MNKQTIITSLLALFTLNAVAQTSFDSKEGCLNVVDFTLAKGLGKYGNGCLSVSYLHESFINEQFSIGGGIGYCHHKKYDFSAIPVYLSTHYFFLDKRYSPFVNLRIGAFGMMGKKNVDTNLKYSIAKKQPDFNLYLSPSIGIKAHITSNIGVLASVTDEAFLVKAFDTSRNDYRNMLIHSLGISIGMCFQIKGW